MTPTTSPFSTTESIVGDFISLMRNTFDFVNFDLVGDIIFIACAVFSVFFIFLIAYCAVRMVEIRNKEHEHLHHEIEEYAHHMKEKAEKTKAGEGVSKNERWLKILDYVTSSVPSDWKLAVLEADSMLGTLLENMNFKGENLGERLKNADRDTFKSLTQAWEVHNIRNKIAHEGPNFDLSDREAKRVIALYEQIFREFGYI
ncbi:MAG: hypothetical protein KBC44_03065 [Candidatus Pacebacteria bacterium]|jgi:hypothetical protein|nr:hypothetical protein [Candidatus Paceibacterota bacterium]MBP9839932.1 hypothetical protein [Candidatus Paceibacterota bacterium]MDQ5922591.1 hypothetical protein [Patescibacteria group bacterium]